MHGWSKSKYIAMWPFTIFWWIQVLCQLSCKKKRSHIKRPKFKIKICLLQSTTHQTIPELCVSSYYLIRVQVSMVKHVNEQKYSGNLQIDHFSKNPRRKEWELNMICDSQWVTKTYFKLQWLDSPAKQWILQPHWWDKLLTFSFQLHQDTFTNTICTSTNKKVA